MASDRAELKLRCPACERALPGTAMMTWATTVVTRTCRCRARWLIKVVPMRSGIKDGQRYHIHSLEFKRLDT